MKQFNHQHNNAFKIATRTLSCPVLIHYFFYCLFLFLIYTPSYAQTLATDRESLFSITKKHAENAQRRIVTWQTIMATTRTHSELQKLGIVNKFFNQIPYQEDIVVWHKEDYWATPIEFLSVGAGDCEDFAIAKYFTLKELGIPETKMRITYVTAINLHRAHMVLTYYSTPTAEPLVLDSLINEIKPASQRTDLLPVYSFNGEGLWLAKQRGDGQYVGGSGQISLWQDLRKRMQQKGFK